MRNIITEISEDKIILIATHIVSDIEFIADEILLIKRGECILEGSPLKLIDSIEGKVGECRCTKEELPALQEQYGSGNVFQRADGIFLPAGRRCAAGAVSGNLGEYHAGGGLSVLSGGINGFQRKFINRNGEESNDMVRRRFRSISPKTGERNRIKACSCNKEADVIWGLFYVSVLLEIDPKKHSVCIVNM